MADPNAFRSVLLHPSIPTKLCHYLERDEPQLGLVVISFHNATLVTLSWPHTLFDALGMGELLHAWSLMLQGQPDKIALPHATRHDPLAELGCHPTETYMLNDSRLSWFQSTFCRLQFVFKAIFYRHQSRMICIPASFVRKIHQDALCELSNDTKGDIKPFLSEGDVLSAWWARVNVDHLRNSSKLVNLSCALGWRSTLAEDLLPSNKPYLSNAVGMLNVLISAKVLLRRPLSYAAAQIRQALAEFRTREQVEAYAALCRESKYLIPPMFGNATMRTILNTNWSKAKFFNLDFSGAIIQPGIPVSPYRPGFPAYAQSIFNTAVPFNLLITLGKDFEGNYWLNGVTEKTHWAGIEEAIMNGRGT
jgi:hypothetical protein